MRRILRRQSAAAVTQQACSPRSHTNPLSQLLSQSLSQSLNKRRSNALRRELRRQSATAVTQQACSPRSHTNPLSQLLSQSLSQPLSQSTQLSKGRKHCSRQIRRTLRRNQAAIRPPSSRTPLSSPRSHIICSLQSHVKLPHSKRRTTLQFGLLSPRA